MKKLLIIIFLFSSLSAFASNISETKKEHNWKLVVSNSDGSNYTDWNNLKRDEDFVYFWELVDFSSPFPNGTLSIKAHRKADCNDNRVQNLHLISYSENMGLGEVISDTNYQRDWELVPKKSIAATSILEVCNFTFLRREYLKSLEK